MKRSSESYNPYQAPIVEYVSQGRVPAIGFLLSLLCGWSSVLCVTGYSLIGMIANGYEMAVQFSNWRLRVEVQLVVLFGFGVILCLLMRIAHRRRRKKGVIFVGVLALPGLAYVVSDLFYLEIGRLFAEVVSVTGEYLHHNPSGFDFASTE